MLRLRPYYVSYMPFQHDRNCSSFINILLKNRYPLHIPIWEHCILFETLEIKSIKNITGEHQALQLLFVQFTFWRESRYSDIPTPFCLPQLVKSLPFHMPDTWERNPILRSLSKYGMIWSTSPMGGVCLFTGQQFTLKFLPASRSQRCMHSNKLDTFHGATETRGVIVFLRNSFLHRSQTRLNYKQWLIWRMKTMPEHI